VCIDVDGAGACAQPVPLDGCDPDTYPDPDTRTRFGTDVDVVVCSDMSQTCVSGVCRL
jgi:hypothetical protein